MDKNSELLSHYKTYDESSRMFSSKAKSIEYFTTVSCLDKYIKPSHSILELGAGGGIYTEYLAQRCKRITASDIVPEYVDEIRNRCQKYSNVEISILDAEDLTKIHDQKYDVILCLGPLYHIQDRTKRMALLGSCKNILVDSGLLFAGYVNKFYAMSLYIKYNKFFNKNEYQLFNKGNFSKLTNIDKFMGFSYYTDPESIEKELYESGFTVDRHIAVDGFYNLISDNMEEMSDQQFMDFLEYHKSVCEERCSLGCSSHGLIICKK